MRMVWLVLRLAILLAMLIMVLGEGHWAIATILGPGYLPGRVPAVAGADARAPSREFEIELRIDRLEQWRSVIQKEVDRMQDISYAILVGIALLLGESVLRTAAYVRNRNGKH